MKKSWILILVFAFALGVTLNLYLQKDSAQTEPTASFTLETEGDSQVDIFSTDDPRIRIFYSVLLVVRMFAQLHWRCLPLSFKAN